MLIGMIELLLTLAQADADPVIRLDTAPVRQSLDERLEARLASLREAATPAEADVIADEVLSLWRQQAGPAADLLLSRAADADERGDDATAQRALDHFAPAGARLRGGLGGVGAAGGGGRRLELRA